MRTRHAILVYDAQAPMRRWATIPAIGVVAVALAVAGLYLALPANETETQGAADPILGLRRQAIGLLRAIGLVEGPVGFFDTDPWLPSAGGSEWMRPGTKDIVAARLSRLAEPVYRGLLWVVGDRVTVRMEEFEEPERDVRLLRLGYVRDGRKLIAGEARFEAGARDRRVSGFVPRASAGYFAEEVDAAGDVWRCSWGTDELSRVLDAASR